MCLTVEAGHVKRFLLNEAITFVQLTNQKLAATEKVHQVILVDWHSLGYITVVRSRTIIFFFFGVNVVLFFLGEVLSGAPLRLRIT